MSLDHSSWQAANASALRKVKEDFTDALNNDKNFISSYGPNIVFDAENTYKNEIEIALSPIDDVVEAIKSLKYVAPEKPSALANPDTTKYTGHVFYDQRLDEMEADLRALYATFQENGGFSFNAESLQEAIQSALYDRGIDKDYNDAEIEAEKIASAWAVDGYDLPPGAMSFEVSSMLEKLDRMRTEKTDGVFGKVAEVVQKNIQWAFENGISIERLHMDFTEKYSQISRNIIEAAVSAYIAEIEKRKKELFAALSKIDYSVNAAELDFKAEKEKVTLELEENFARLSSSISNFSSYMNATADMIKQQIKLASNISDGYEAIFSAYGNAMLAVSYENQSIG